MREFNNIKIAVAGTGYVGMSIATLLAQHHEVVAVDVLPEKVEKINQKISPIQGSLRDATVSRPYIVRCNHLEWEKSSD